MLLLLSVAVVLVVVGLALMVVLVESRIDGGVRALVLMKTWNGVYVVCRLMAVLAKLQSLRNNGD